MKKSIFIITVLILALLSFQSCTKKEPIRIGLVGTMTGNQSDLSVSGRRGVEIAVNEINDKGGVNGRLIELVVKDDKNDSEIAKSIVQEFVDEGVKVVIGHYTSGMMLAAYDEVVKNDILYLGPTISADTLSQIDDNFIRFIASTKEQAQIITEVAMKSGDKNFIVIIDEKNIGFNQYLFDNFEEMIVTNGGKIQNTLKFETLNESKIEEILQFVDERNDIDSLFIIANANDLATIVQEIRKKGSELTVYGPLWAHTLDLLRVGGEYIEGTKVVSAIDLKSEDEKYIEFSKIFTKRYGREATFSSVYSYETLMALVKALESSKDMTTENIKQSIISIGEFDGLQQSFLIDEFGDNTRQYMMEIIQDGDYIRID